MKHRKRLLIVASLATVLAAPLAANQLDPDEKIDIELASASLAETLQSFAAITGSRLDLADDLEGEVTIAAKSQPWPRILDDVCRRHELRCESFGADPPTLRIRSADAEGGPAGFARAISLELHGAPLDVVFTSFEKLSGRSFQVADDVTGTVSFSFRKIPWPRALEEICALSGCGVTWGGDTVVIEPLEAEESPRLDMALAGADVGEVLRAFAAFPIFDSTETRVEIDPVIQGDVTVELKNVNWTQALDLVCAQAGCGWTLEYGDPSVLHVFPVDADHPQATSRVHAPGAEVQTLAYRFEPPGGPPLTGVAAFTWAEPIHVRATGGPQRLRLSWIPLGPERSVVLPLLERCEATAGSVVLLDPVVLPVVAEARRQAGGATLTITAAPANAPRPVAKAAAPCGPERPGEIEVTVRRRADRAGDAPRAERRFHLESHLMVTPVEMREPVAALVVLGAGPEGRQELALLRPGQGDASVELESLVLARGGKLERTVEADGRSFELVIEHRE